MTPLPHTWKLPSKELPSPLMTRAFQRSRILPRSRRCTSSELCLLLGPSRPVAHPMTPNDDSKCQLWEQLLYVDHEGFFANDEYVYLAEKPHRHPQQLSGDRPALTVDDEKALTMTLVRKARKKNGLSYYEHIRKSLHTLLPAFTA